MRKASSDISKLRKQVWGAAYAALNLLFPPRCAACGSPGCDLCANCYKSFESVGSRACPICSEIREDSRAGPCLRCSSQTRAFRKVRSAFRYHGALRKAVHAFKYRGRANLAAPLAQAMLEALPAPRSTTRLCAVPLHAKRERERGYNQSKLLMQELSAQWKINCLPDAALVRILATTSQVGQGYRERQANMEGAFQADYDIVAGHEIIVIDDVYTTGATIQACARALLSAGAVVVDGLTLARAIGHVPVD